MCSSSQVQTNYLWHSIASSLLAPFAQRCSDESIAIRHRGASRGDRIRERVDDISKSPRPWVGSEGEVVAQYRQRCGGLGRSIKEVGFG